MQLTKWYKYVDKQRKYELEAEPENVNGVLITKKLLNKERKNICPVCGSSVKNINDDMLSDYPILLY